MQKIIMIVVVLLLCQEDIREQQLDCRLLLTLAFCGVSMTVLQGVMNRTYLCALLPGVLCMAVSLFSGEAIGEGDALTLWSLGFSLSPEEMIRLCVESFLLAGLAGLFCCIQAGDRRHIMTTPIPFLPFVTISLIWMLQGGFYVRY